MNDQPRPTPRTDSVSVQNLKTWPKYFDAVERGAKTFEIRKNDRPFLIGQKLVLQEYDPDDEKYTGREIERRISYMTDFEQKPGFVVLGLERESDAREERIRELEKPGWFQACLKIAAMLAPLSSKDGVVEGVEELVAENAKLREALERANEQGRLTHRAYLCDQGISEGDAAMEANRIFPDCQALAGKDMSEPAK